MRGFVSPQRLSLGRKMLQINWGLILIVMATAAIGVAMLYSAANGSWNPWATRQIARYAVGLVILITVALVDIRLWWRYSYLLYAALLALLAAVEVVGSIGMGAQRWINLGVIKLQPSELMKVGLTLALARYFHGVSSEDVRRIPYLFVPIVLIALPSALVLKQPDLGTALFLIMIGGSVFFVAGVRMWKFGLVLAAAGAAVPIVWSTLRTYQQRRILTFLDPESDPLGAGYHILQSKIALGSGGLFGKGFMQGSQSHLNFLPEKQTDFIFTMMAEEFGMAGGLLLLGSLHPDNDLRFRYWITVTYSLWSAIGLGPYIDVVSLRFHQYCDGDGSDPCRGRAATANFLWRERDADPDDRHRVSDQRLRSPRCNDIPDGRRRRMTVLQL